MILPEPPARLLPPNTGTLARGTHLFRIHREEYAPAAFNPCAGAPSRFAPITDRPGSCVPSLYAATSHRAAAFETILHDILPGPFATAPDQMLQARNASTLRLRRDLTIARLHAPDLRRWSLAPADLSAAPSREYVRTARWAEAIHRQFPDLDGLVWTSNKCDPERCFVFFGDRVGEGDFEPIESTSLGAPGPTREAVVAAGHEAGITIILA